MTLSSLALIGCLVGCDKPAESDSTPPDHIINLQKSQGKYRFGITDTIAIDFSEKIDSGALDLVFTPPEGIDHQLVDGSKLLIFGKNKTYGGSSFIVNSPFTLAITGLRDLKGNGQPRIEESFAPYLWADQDFVDANFKGAYDSLNATDSTWIDGSPSTDTMVTEGSLDFKLPPGTLDYQDIKVVKVKGGDTLYTSLTTRKNLDLSILVAGPFPIEGLDSTLKIFDYKTVVDSAQTLASGFANLKTVADFTLYRRKLGNPDALGLYVFIISVPPKNEGFYRLGVQIRKFQ